jgi:orotidine-5'-phosphate decarboxylase
MYNMDKLYTAVAERGPVCVGLDTATASIPPTELERAASLRDAVFSYNKRLIDATIDVCACYKVQIAYYEAFGLAGLSAYVDTLRYARSENALVIADIKRGDIADTAAQYAKAHFSGLFEADFVTLSPYMGMDTLDPWFSYAESAGKGAFVLMRTSNAGMRDFEYRELKDGGRLYHAVGNRLAEKAGLYAGIYGYGVFGAVVGCTEMEEAAEIRRKYANLFFLIPGYGAQGGGAESAAVLLRNGNGGVVNASRSILNAWKKHGAERIDNEGASHFAREEVISMRDAIRRAAFNGEKGGK